MPVLLDIAAPYRARRDLTGYGTPGYTAPEVVDGQRPTPRTDVFGAGLLLAELALGRRLFPKVVEDHLAPVGGYAEPIQAATEELDREMGTDLARMLSCFMALDPAQRPADATEAAEMVAETAALARVRKAATRQRGSSSLTGLERRLPRPLAQVLRSWRLAREPQRRLFFAFGLAETFTRYLAALALVDYLSRPWRDDGVEEQLAGLGQPLTFGRWQQLLRTLLNALRERPGQPFIAELPDLLQGDNLAGIRQIDKIVPDRNLVAHGRMVVPSGAVPEKLKRVEKHLRRLLECTRFLGAYPLLFTEEQRALRDGRFESTVLEMHGSPSEPDRRVLVSRTPPVAGTLSLCRFDFSERLILDPFLVHQPCPCCQLDHVFLWSGGDKKGRISYLHYASGHSMKERPLDAAEERRPLLEVLAQREELNLLGPLGVEATESERYWTGEMPCQQGQLLGGRYELGEEIGRGAMGVVFSARYPATGGRRAVKMIRPDLAGTDRGLLRRLGREAAILERLKDQPNIVRLYEFGVTDDESTCYLVMELLEGGTLEDRLTSGDLPSMDELIQIASGLGATLAVVHEAGVIHRDLKPSNILLDKQGRPRIADFGVARDLTVRGTATAGFVGALLYSAPEQLSGGKVGPWTDAFSLGLLLYDLTTGQIPMQDSVRRAQQIPSHLKAAERGDSVSKSIPNEIWSDQRIVPWLAYLAALTRQEPSSRPENPAMPPELASAAG